MTTKPRVFDTALPQEWVNEVQELTGLDPRGHFVWSYDEPNNVFGTAFPVSEQGCDILTLYNLLRGI